MNKNNNSEPSRSNGANAIVGRSFDELENVYENSFPYMKEAWESLCAARKAVGWKDFYFMVLRMQKETSEGSAYHLRGSH